MTDRHTLEADLIRYQESGDFAAQAKTLMALARIDQQDDGYGLTMALYGQAWAAYEQANDQRGMAKAIAELAETMADSFLHEGLAIGHTLNDVTLVYEMALTIFVDLNDAHEQAEIYHQMADAHLYPRERVQQLLHHALALYEHLDDRPNQVHILRSLLDWCDTGEPETPGYIAKAQALYQALDDKQGEFELMQLISKRNLGSPESQTYINRAFDLCRQLGDQHAEALLYLNVGRWSQNHEESLHCLETARRMFMEIQDDHGVLAALDALGLVIAREDGYAAYLRFHEEAMRQVRSLPQQQHGLFQRLSDTARQHKDFVTAGYGFQQAIMLVTALGRPYEQVELYWVWGRMEYKEAGHKQMGLMLCQRAVTLANHYFPGQNRYQKKVHIMRREMKRLQERRPIL